MNKLANLIIICVLCAMSAFAASVTTATGGSAIPNSTAGGNFTNLTGPIIAELSSIDIGNGTIVLNAPSGFEFDTNTTVTILVLRTAGGGPPARNINNVASGTSLPISSITTAAITFTVTDTTDSDSGPPGPAAVTNSLTWQGVRVRPTAALPLASGNITLSGNSSIVNVSSGSSLGALTEIAIDTTAPNVTVPSNMTVEATSASGASASFNASAVDDVDGALTPICAPVSGSTFALGATSVNCSATDAANNTGSATFTITVADSTAPSLTVPANITEEATSPAGAIVDYMSGYLPAFSVTDAVDASPSLSCTPFPGPFAIGTTIITCNATDASSNSVVKTFSVSVVDTTGPAITLSGSTPVDVEVGTPYADSGATASDIVDGDVTGSIITVNPVDSDTVDAYVVTYNVNDSSGNAATEVTRTVNVVDTTDPVITILGANPIDVSLGSVYSDAGATATDNYDGNLTGSIVTDDSAVDTGTIGSYVVTYDVTDANGNTDHEERTVNVVDTAIPIITMLGTSPIDVPLGSVYTDDGATALDDVDGNITGSIVVTSDVDTGTIGTYTVEYDVSDSSGNDAATVTRTVNVVDVTAPVITLTGSDPVDVEVGTPYVDDGATASDDVDGDITASIITVNPVDSGTIGVYTVTYNVEDAAGNAATEVTRTVNVVDSTPPAVVSAVTQDTDSDGQIDSIELTFSEPIDDGMLDVGEADGWDVYDYDGESIDTGDVSDDEILVLSFTESGVPDTSATPGVYYTESGGSNSTHDLEGNELEEAEFSTDDGAAPLLSLVGASPVSLTTGGVYTEEGATISDAADIDEDDVVVGGDAVDTGTIGTYIVTYDFTDGWGNDAAQITRTVTVSAPPAPSSSSSGGGGGGGGGGNNYRPYSRGLTQGTVTPPTVAPDTKPVPRPQTPTTQQNNPPQAPPVIPPQEVPPSAPNPAVPQATGVFGLQNTPITWLAIFAILAALLGLGAWAFRKK